MTPSETPGAGWRVDHSRTPVEGESLDGYVMDIAADNWLGNTFVLASVAGADHPNRPTLGLSQWDGLPALADCMGVPVDELRRRAHPPADQAGTLRTFFGTPILHVDIEKRTRRFAPASFAGGRHHRALWQIRLLPFCEESWTYVTDTCRRCSSVQRWYHATPADTCDLCGSPLDEDLTPEVAGELRDDLRLACGLVHPSADRRSATLAELPDTIGGLGAQSAWALLRRLAVLADPSIVMANRVARIELSTPATTLAAAMAQGAALLRNWPKAPMAFMTERLAVSTAPRSDGHGLASIRFLKGRSEHMPTPAARAVEELRASVDLDGPRGDAVRDATRSLNETSAALRLGHVECTWLRREDAIGTRFSLKKGFAIARYDADEIDDLKAFLDDRCLTGAAVKRIGVSSNGIEQLIAVGPLEGRWDRFTMARYGIAQTTVTAVEDLVARIEMAAGPPGPGRPLRLAMKVVGGRLKPWAPVFASLLDGRLPFSMKAEGARLTDRIVVSDEHLPLLAAADFDFEAAPFAFGGSMSDRDAGEVLNCKWALYGPLVAGLHDDQGRVPVSEVIRLAETCIMNIEIALRLRVSAREANRRAIEAGTVAIAPGVWSRTSAETLLGLPARLERRWKEPQAASFRSPPPWLTQWVTRGPWGRRVSRSVRKSAPMDIATARR